MAEAGSKLESPSIKFGFAEIVETMQPTPTLFLMTNTMSQIAWSLRAQQLQGIRKTLDRELKEPNSQIDKIVDRMMDMNYPRVITTYETKLDDLARQKLILEEKRNKTAIPTCTFDEMFELACLFL